MTLPTNAVLATDTKYPLQQVSTVVTVPSYISYEYWSIYQGILGRQFGTGLGWFILLLTIFFLLNNRISNLYTLWDTVQLLFVIIFLDIQYPPALNEFILGLKTTFFSSQTFLNLFSSVSSRAVSSLPFYAYSYDNDFCRNAGPSLTLGIIILIFFLLLKLAGFLYRKIECIK